MQKENQRKEEQRNKQFEEAGSDPSFLKLKEYVVEVANGPDYYWKETAKGFQFSNEELYELISLWKSLTRQKLWPIPTGLAYSPQHKEDLAKRIHGFIRQIDILSKVGYDPEKECYRQMTEEQMRHLEAQLEKPTLKQAASIVGKLNKAFRGLGLGREANGDNNLTQNTAESVRGPGEESSKRRPRKFEDKALEHPQMSYFKPD